MVRSVFSVADLTRLFDCSGVLGDFQATLLQVMCGSFLGHRHRYTEIPCYNYSTTWPSIILHLSP